MYQGLVSVFYKGQMVNVIDFVGDIVLLIQTNFVCLQFWIVLEIWLEDKSLQKWAIEWICLLIPVDAR